MGIWFVFDLTCGLTDKPLRIFGNIYAACLTRVLWLLPTADRIPSFSANVRLSSKPFTPISTNSVALPPRIWNSIQKNLTMSHYWIEFTNIRQYAYHSCWTVCIVFSDSPQGLVTIARYNSRVSQLTMSEGVSYAPFHSDWKPFLPTFPTFPWSIQRLATRDFCVVEEKKLSKHGRFFAADKSSVWLHHKSVRQWYTCAKNPYDATTKALSRS